MIEDTEERLQSAEKTGHLVQRRGHLRMQKMLVGTGKRPFGTMTGQLWYWRERPVDIEGSYRVEASVYNVQSRGHLVHFCL